MPAPFSKTVIVVCGPTAVGKTSVAIQLAKRLHTEIISADSRQCFKELNIGVARPSIDELNAVPHHFIATHSIQEEITAAYFENYALEKVNKLFTKHDFVVVAGGTGLYIKAFCEGLDAIPKIDESIRKNIISNFEKHGIGWLQNEIAKKDALFYEQGEIKNPQRLMRALEVVEATGKSILSYRKEEKANRDFRIIKIGIELPKEVLHQNINKRVDAMMVEGLLNEIKSVMPYRKTNALQTVGYTELFDFLDGNTTLEKAVDLIKIHTRQYAKRQLTWFRKDKEIQWFLPTEVEKIHAFIQHS